MEELHCLLANHQVDAYGSCCSECVYVNGTAMVPRQLTEPRSRANKNKRQYRDLLFVNVKSTPKLSCCRKLVCILTVNTLSLKVFILCMCRTIDTVGPVLITQHSNNLTGIMFSIIVSA